MPVALAVVTATLLVLAFPRFDFTWLAPVALVPLLLGAEQELNPRRRFLAGWLAGSLFFGGLCYWVQFVMAVHGGMGQAGGWAVFPLFCLYKGLPMGLFAWLAGYLIPRWYAAPAVAALWTAVERVHAPMGFTWLQLGHAGSEMGVPLRLAPLVGVYGLSFLFALMNVSVALVVLRRPRKQLGWLLLLPGLYLLPALPEAERGKERAVSLQPNVAEEAQWTREFTNDTIRQLSYLTIEEALSRPKQMPHLLLWPEIPAPFYYQTDPYFREQAAQTARLTHTPFLFGTVFYNEKREPTNSAMMLSSAGDFVARYDKVNLVPFGEFVPPLFGWVNKVSSEVGDFVPGTKRIVFPGNAGQVGAVICYESALPHFVRQFVAEGAEVLVILTNDGYFGHSAAREQHLKVARMRATENRRWLLRTTNNGITAAIDPAGRIAQTYPDFKRMAGSLWFNYHKELTPYTRYGDWFVWLCAVAALLALGHSQIPVYRPVGSAGIEPRRALN